MKVPHVAPTIVSVRYETCEKGTIQSSGLEVPNTSDGLARLLYSVG